MQELSFASIFQIPFLHPEVVESLESKLQENIVKADMKKNILSNFNKGNLNILLLDFIDERFNLLSLNNTVCTLSNEALRTALLEECQDYEIIEILVNSFF